MTIRTAWTADGHIEAAIMHRARVVIDSRTGSVIEHSCGKNAELFQMLVRAARRHVWP